jgi:pheromone shutdown protein TraB
MEALLYIVAVVSALSLLGVAQRFLGADAAHRASLQAVGDSLLDVRDQANLAAVMAFSVGALMYYYLLYHSQLVPRWLSGWGILAIILTLVACLLALFGHHPVTNYVPLVLPIAVQEIVLAVWLIAKGFTSP